MTIDKSDEQVVLLGVKINAISLAELLTIIKTCALKNECVVISNVNIHAVNIAYSLAWFREFLNQSRLNFCDGFGIKLAAKITGQELNYRFTPPDFIDNVCQMAAQSGWRLFFLGAKPGVALRAAEKMKKRYLNLEIKTHHGYFIKDVQDQENSMVIEEINQFHPEILIVGFGMPLQEKWILENIHLLRVNVVLPAGALFDYLSDELPRAPRWMTDHGFEWLGRLVIEPRRLWKRYLIGNPLFFWRVFVHHILGFPFPG